MNRRRRTLPPVPPKAPSELRPLIAAMTEILETGEGVRGDPLDRKVTLRDLLDSGIGKLKPGMRPGQDGNLDSGVLPPAPDLSIPPAPANFDAQGGFYGMINLSWQIPGELYRNHAYTNIYRSETDNFANAEMVGREAGGFYTDSVRDDALAPDDPINLKGYYYWITFTSTGDIEGPPNNGAGTYAEPIADVGYVMDVLTERIDEGLLAQSLSGRLDGFTESIDDLGNLYTVNVNEDGLVGGFGIFNDGTTVEAGFLVDSFWIGRTNSDKRKPFIIDNGVTYIDEAMIRDASIQEGQLGPITIGKLFLDDGTPVTTIGGLIRADAIDVDNLSVAEAASFYGNVQSGNYIPGETGWLINQAGDVEFNDGAFNGTVEFENVNGTEDLVDKVNNANSRVNDWVKPDSTRIDGNKIFTGDAYVDTLEIKGNAVSIPEAVYSNGSTSIGTTWTTVQTAWVTRANSPVHISIGCRYIAVASISSSDIATVNVSLYARLLVNDTIVANYGLLDSSSNSGSGSIVITDVKGGLASTYLLGAGGGTAKVELQLHGSGANLNAIATSRYIQSITVKR